MRATLTLVALALSFQVSAEGCEQEPFQSTRDALFKDVEPTLSSCALLPRDRQTGAALFAFERAGSTADVKAYDVDLLLIDARSNKLKARLSLKGVWESDAYKLDSAEIAKVDYQVRRGTTVFGLTESWSGSSRVSFYSINKLSLFVQRGTRIVPLLTDLVTEIYQGEGCDVHTTRKIEVEPPMARGYASIRVSENRVGMARENLACPPATSERQSDLLRYRNGAYFVPKHLTPWGGAR